MSMPGRHSGPPSPANNPLDEPEYKSFFSDEACHLKPEYVDKWADELAQLFGNPAFAKPPLNKHQMRAFFNQTKRLEAIFRLKPDFEDLKNKLLSMKSQAHLRRNRNNIPENFKKFIDMNVEKAVKSEKAFEAFVQHFTAVAAYCEGRLRGE
jgi:CRISPR type III-A-associated protein Csm2